MAVLPKERGPTAKKDRNTNINTKKNKKERKSKINRDTMIDFWDRDGEKTKKRRSKHSSSSLCLVIWKLFFLDDVPLNSVCVLVYVCARIRARTHTLATTPRVSPANIKNEVVSGQLGLSQEAVGSHATCSSEDRPRRGGEEDGGGQGGVRGK